MPNSFSNDAVLWAATLSRARRELANLPAPDRNWLASQICAIAQLQQEIDYLFHEIGGPETCANCRGGCCGSAKHHTTLTNVLGYFLANTMPPKPDFNRPCPFLGQAGCRLPVPYRPFNCIIFFCEILDARLSKLQRARFVTVEKALRASYVEVASRCPGASLHGLLVAADRVGDRPLLAKTT